MSKEEALKTLLENGHDDDRLKTIEEKINFLMDAIVVQQKDAVELVGKSHDTIRRRADKGEITPLQRDGSRSRFYTVSDLFGLKPQKK